MSKLSITVTLNLPNLPETTAAAIVAALKAYHVEEYRYRVTSLLAQTPVEMALDRNLGTSVDVSILPDGDEQDEFEDQVARWLESEVEDGKLDTRDICLRVVRWGLRPPADVLEEIRERMRNGGLLNEGSGAADESPEEPPTQLPFIAPPVAPFNVGVATCVESVPSLVDVLDEVEGFIANFEDDKALDVKEMLERVRARHKLHSETPLVDGRTAFLAVFHGLIGAYPSSDGVGAYRGLWPVAGALNREHYVELRKDAMLKAMGLLGAGFCTRVQAENWLDSAGWIVPGE